MRNLPDAFLSDPNTPPSLVSSLIGLDGDGCEIYEITVETIGYFCKNFEGFCQSAHSAESGRCDLSRIKRNSRDRCFRRNKIRKSARRISVRLLTREQGEVPVVLSVKDVVSTHLAILASTGSGKSYTAGVLVEELMNQYNRAAVLIVDPHGEYHTMSSIMGSEQFFGEDGYRPEVKIYTPDKIKVRFSTLTEADVKYLLPEGTSDKMAHFLSQAFRSLHEKLKMERRQDYAYAYHDLRDEVNAQKYGNENQKDGSAAMFLRLTVCCGGSIRALTATTAFFPRRIISR